MSNNIVFEAPKSVRNKVNQLGKRWEKLKKECMDFNKWSSKLRRLFSSKKTVGKSVKSQGKNSNKLIKELSSTKLFQKASASNNSEKFETEIKNIKEDLNFIYMEYYDDKEIKESCKKYLDDICSFCVKQGITLSKENLLNSLNYKYGINKRIETITRLLDRCFKTFDIADNLKEFGEIKNSYEFAVKIAKGHGIKIDKGFDELKDRFDGLMGDCHRFVQFSDEVKKIEKELDGLKRDCKGRSEWSMIFKELDRLLKKTTELHDKLKELFDEIKSKYEIYTQLVKNWAVLINKNNFAAKLSNMVVFDNNMGIAPENAFDVFEKLEKTTYGEYIRCESQNALLIAKEGSDTKIQYDHKAGDGRFSWCKGPYYVLVNEQKKIEKNAYTNSSCKTINSSSDSPGAEDEVNEYLRKALQAGEWKQQY